MVLDIVHIPPEQVSAPITKPVVVHGVATTGFTQVAPLQYIPPEITFTPVQAAPTTGAFVFIAHIPAVHVKAPTVIVPVHGVATAGAVQLAPLQYTPPKTVLTPVQAEPTTGVFAFIVHIPAVHVKAPTVIVPAQGVATAGAVQ